MTSLILILVGLTAGLALWLPKGSKQTLSDGTILVLSGVKIGRTNVYTHGTLLSKLIGRFAPAKGITFGRFKLQPPIKITIGGEPMETVCAEVQLLHAGSPRRELSFISPAFYRKFRLLVSGDDDFVFVQEFDRFKLPPDGTFGYFSARSFPRDSRLLHFRLEERDDSNKRDWREVTTFIVKNPSRASIQPWKGEHSTRFKLDSSLDVEVGELVVRHEPIHPIDIWEYLALLPIRITNNTQAVTNWGIREGTVEDASGNFDHFTFSKIMTNDWMVYRMFRPLDPTKPWRFNVKFAIDSDFPKTNLFSFVVPFGLTTSIRTNLGGQPVEIGFVNSDMLSVQLTNKPAATRLTFVTATDDGGNNLDGRTGSWGQHSFWRRIERPPTPQIHVTVAIHPTYPATFTLLPRLERKPEIQKASSSR